MGLRTSVLGLSYHTPSVRPRWRRPLEALSGGRLTLGTRAGVIEQELQAMGSPFSERGAITHESIAIMKELGTQEDPSYRGRFRSFSGMKFSPKAFRAPEDLFWCPTNCGWLRQQPATAPGSHGFGPLRICRLSRFLQVTPHHIAAKISPA